MRRFALALGLGLAALPALAPSAWANDITVDVNTDAIADTGTCTLREAITNANNNSQVNALPGECGAGASGTDQILFSGVTFGGMVGPSTITTSGLPDITEDLIITSGPPIGPILKPRVGIKVSPAGSNEALKVAPSATLTAIGLAITQASVGIDAGGGATLSTQNTWFGLSLDQTVVAGNGIGVQLGSGSTIGDINSAMPVVFAGNTTAGVRIFGGDDNLIQRSNFGVRNDGTTVAGGANATNIRIVDDGDSSNPAGPNTVGVADATTPGTCDLGCNLILNATGSGIDLAGTGGAEAPATGGTTVVGNFIGLNPGGSSALPNGTLGNPPAIEIGDATDVTIGGASEGGRNYIAGNSGIGVRQGSGGDNLVIRNNYLGVSATGDAPLADSQREISTEGTDTSITNNLIGGSSVLVSGTDAIVKSNAFGVGPLGEDVGTNDETFLLVDGDDAQVGGAAAGEGNTIGNVDGSTSGALDLDGERGIARGNLIGVDAGGMAQPNAGHGILIAFSAPDNDLIVGGTAPGQANVISNSGSDAIHVPDGGMSTNEVLRANTGRNNGSLANDLFIDLGTNGPGNSDVNEGIAAPVVTSATATQIQGTSPEVDGSLIDVYKTFTSRGDVRTYLGQTTVTSGGWSFTYPTALGAGACVTAAQTQTAMPKGTSELAPVTTIGGGACDVTPPTASIVSGPSGLTSDRTPAFGLSSSEAGSTFECSIDSGAFSACANPFTTPSLGDGDHTLQVRSTDFAGNTSPPSATRNFEIDATSPQTTITRFIKKPRRRRAKVIFSSNEPGSTFECKLDGRTFAPCTSPKTYRRLKRGRRHTIKVRAIDAAGNADPTPIQRSLRIRSG